MKYQKILVSLIVMTAILLVLPSVFAVTGNLGISLNEVSIKGVDITTPTAVKIAGFAGENIPVRVEFTANQDADDARIKVWISGYRSSISAETERFQIVNGSTYSRLLSIVLPYDIDLTEDTKIYVRVETKTNYKEEEFNLRLQRESYTAEILSAEMQSRIAVGGSLPVTVVLKNRGFNKLDDVFVRVSMPELGLQKTVYFWDLSPNDNCSGTGSNNCETEDSAERTIYFNLPAEMNAGIYKVEIEAYNGDFSEKISRNIIVDSESKSEVLPTVVSKKLAKGEEAVYELIIVNPSNKVKVYSIVSEQTSNLIVEPESSIVTVEAGSSRVVKVKVTASETGTYNFAINVDSEGKLVQRVNLNAVVEAKTIASSVIVWTIILVIVLVVLLVVLLVLLTRKPATVEETEESYY